MENIGVAPPDLATQVGAFRLRAGDMEWTPLDPDVPGMGDYQRWSDDEIQVFLEVSDSLNWAIYEAYLQLATSAAIESKSISDYDLKIDTTKRAEQLLRIAEAWRDRADNDDVAAAEEGFEIVPTGRTGGDFIPEGVIPQWGRRYTWAKWGG